MIHILDDFLASPSRMRQSALESGFGTWKPNKGEVGSSVYEGMNFWGDHAMGIWSLAQFHQRVILPNSMFFRVTNKGTEGAYVHSDREMGQFTCIVYLSEHSDSGTGFYRHRDSGAVSMESFEDMRQDPEAFEKLKIEMVEGSDKVWELTEFVRGGYNRALIFDAPLFHARIPKHGFGDTVEDGRMVWVCHYDL